MTKLLLFLNFYTVLSATCRRKRDFQVVYEKIERQKKIYNFHDRVSIRNSFSANLAEFNSKLISIEFSKEERTITGMGFLKVFFNRYRRGLETCPQAKTFKSERSATTLFSCFFFRRVRATSMTQRRVEKLAFTFERFRLYRFTIFCP